MIKRISADMFVLRETGGGLCHRFTEEVMRLCHPVSWDLVSSNINDKGSGIVGKRTARLVRKRMVTVLSVYALP